jgi:hypothetical protein
VSGFLVVATRSDASAHWAWRGLRERGYECEFVLTEELATADVRWCHRVGTSGSSVEVSLADGRCLRSGHFSALLNRAFVPPLTALARAGWRDSDYARSEQVAFCLSWLRALSPVVVNPPTARGLAGAWRSPLEWRQLAATAGFEVEPLVADSHCADRVKAFPFTPPDGLVVGDQAFGTAGAPEVKAAAIRLSRLAATPILGLWFSDRRRLQLKMATPHPDLTVGGGRALTALERLLAT